MYNTIQVTRKDKYVILGLNRGKANPINLEMIAELREFLLGSAEDDSINGVIITGKDNFFSAGLDLPALFVLDEKQSIQFWKDFAAMIYSLASFPKPLIAAMTGHSPAGGTVLGICCDYRVLASGNYKIGLNEIPVGIAVPETILNLYAFWLGRGKAYQMIMEGKLVGPDEALRLGMVDELAAPDQVLQQAEAKMALYLSFDNITWQRSKMNLRASLIASLDVDFDTAFKATMEQWWAPSTRATLQKLVNMLQKN